MTIPEPASALKVQEPAHELTPVLSTLVLLAVGTFAVGTDAFVLSGLLPSMAADLKVSVATMGQLVTLFAVVYALSAPLIAALTAAWNRRNLLMCAQLVFVVGMILQAAGTRAEVIAIGRVVAALGAAGYTAAATAVAAALVGPSVRGRALAVVLGGITVATVLGVPLGVFLGKWLGWRATLLAVAGLGALAALGALAVPALRLPVPGLATRLAALRRPGVLGVLSVTIATLAGGFTMYTYLPSLLEPVASGGTLGWVLLLYGSAGAVGNALAGRWTDRIGPLPVLRLGIAGIGIVGLLIPIARWNLYTALLAMFVWPCAGWATGVPQQHRLLGLGPDVAPVLLGWNASANYAGIALGAIFGGVALELGSAAWLGPTAAVCSAIALLLTLLPTKRPAAAGSATTG